MKPILDTAFGCAANLATRMDRALATRRDSPRGEEFADQSVDGSSTFLIDRWDALAVALILGGAHRG